MYQNIDIEKLADVQSVANKVKDLPEKALLYIAGYAEGALDATRKQAGAASRQQAEERDSA